VDQNIELIGGIEKREIQVISYNRAWPERFLWERARIAGAIGSLALRIGHVGSTAVPGLAAKPIIDIQVSVGNPEDEASYLAPLLIAGYHLRVREPGHRMARTLHRDVHVHICGTGSDWERRHLLFRDWLRRDTRDRDAYQRLKQDLARQDWPDMNAYADAKGPLINEITQRAETWARATYWTPRCGTADGRGG